jgi:hypothetical protein
LAAKNSSLAVTTEPRSRSKSGSCCSSIDCFFPVSPG